MGAGSATQRIDREGPGGAFPVVEPDSWGREGALGPAREAGSAARGRGSEWRSQKKGNRAPKGEGSSAPRSVALQGTPSPHLPSRDLPSHRMAVTFVCVCVCAGVAWSSLRVPVG